MADFETFRELMHSYKEEELREMNEGMEGDLPPLTPSPDPQPHSPIDMMEGLGGKVSKRKCGGLRVSVQALKVHCEEQEDGDERPDLNGFALTISSPQSNRTK
jgi:hypothetical protein